MFVLIASLIASPNAHATPNVQQVIAYIQVLEQRIEDLEADNAELRSVMTVNGNEVTFQGVNVRITNGTGDNDTLNSSGNLIIGYNNVPQQDRTGSHNVVLGEGNRYTSHSGLVGGSYNDLDGAYGLTFGVYNTVVGSHSSIVGGAYNTVSSRSAYGVIVGGEYNGIDGGWTSVLGGFSNDAVGDHTTVSGGAWNFAQGNRGSVCGGSMNRAIGFESTVLGGQENFAQGDWSTITGGLGQETNYDYEVR